ncbi:hypothetical protein SBA4_1990005 [Candidatus Sulfopaludibacter sp. SbA4]|nr:hypothetical protein SBA4_1990005 [Candidatus Sulfopaludibacter sp. SbA4]
MLESPIGTEMNPPLEPQTSETLAHAVESLKRSDRPLTAREILKSIPPPSRVPLSALEPLLNGDPRVAPWPPRGRSSPPRYWTRRPEDVADFIIMDLPADASLAVSEIQKKVGRQLAGFSAAERRALIESSAKGLVAAGKLYQHPPPKGTQLKYGPKPAKANAYVAKLLQQLDALAAKLAPYGIARAQILEALSEESRPDGLQQRIVEYLKAKPGGIGLGQLREDLGLSLDEKAAFDRAALSLYRDRRVYLDQHDYPLGLDEAAKSQLVSDGSGNYFVVISLRDADAESIP